jgi:hypothetical protein
MKNSIFKIALAGCLIAGSITSCKRSEAEDDLDTQQEMERAQDKIEESRKDSIEMSDYKQSVEEKLIFNDQQINDLKENNKEKDKLAKEEYEMQLKDLEDRNEQLRRDLRDYNDKDMSKWDQFTIDFNQRVDDLGESISKMAERNIEKHK